MGIKTHNMTDKEYKENKVIGYGILPCLIISIAVSVILFSNIKPTAEMTVGIALGVIAMFGGTAWVWIMLVRLYFWAFVK